MHRPATIALFLVAATCAQAESLPRLPRELQLWSQSFCQRLEAHAEHISDRRLQQSLQYFLRHEFQPALAAVRAQLPPEYHPYVDARLKARSAPSIRVADLLVDRATFYPDRNEIVISPDPVRAREELRYTWLHELIHCLIEPRRSRELLERRDHTYLMEGMTEYLTLCAAQRAGWGDLRILSSYPDEVAVVALLLPEASPDMWYWYLVETDLIAPLVHDRIAARLVAAGIDQAAAAKLLHQCQRKYQAYQEYVYELPPPYLVRAYETQATFRQHLSALTAERQKLEQEGVSSSDERIIQVENALRQQWSALTAAEQSAKVAEQAAQRQAMSRQRELIEILNHQHLRVIQMYEGTGQTRRQIWDKQLQQGTPNAALWHIRAAMTQK